MRRIGCAFIDENAHPGSQRAIGNVTVPSDPATVSRTPEEIVVPQIKNPFCGRLRPEHVAGGGVLDSLWLSRGTTGVENEKRSL